MTASRTRRRSSPSSAITPARIAAAERRRDALRLRKAGFTYQEISDALGYANRSNARRDVLSALRSATSSVLRVFGETREDVLLLELSRLDWMLSALAPKVERGQVTAIDRVLRIQERRARFLGLDSPVRHVIGGDSNGVPVYVAADPVSVRAAAVRAIVHRGSEPSA